MVLLQCPVFKTSKKRRRFAKYKGKYLYRSLYLKSSRLTASTLLKKRFWHKSFPVNFAKFIRTTFKEHFRANASTNIFAKINKSTEILP